MENPYTELPLSGPHDIGVGGALITMVEPHMGHEREYNRWYEDDHMFSGALYEPWLFSARRWVATHELQQLRYQTEGDRHITQPKTNGCYLSTYWITPGRMDDHKQWAYSVYQRLVAEGRVKECRDHVFTSYQDKAGTVYRDNHVPKDVFTLMDPSPGLVIEMVDAPAPEERPELEHWLLTEHLPARITPTSPISSAMVFRSSGPDKSMTPEALARVGRASQAANDPRRLTVLWFLSAAPGSIWEECFVREAELVRQSGLGEVAFVAPFIPAKMGTNTYDDMLRAPEGE